MVEQLLAAPGWTVQRIVRIGMSLYFLALVLGLVSGSDISFIFRAVLAEPFATFAGNAVLAGLAVLVLVGWQRGAATVILSLLLFVGSYLQLSAHFLLTDHLHTEALPAFWRDFALIALLLLTYTEPERESAKNAPFRHKAVTTPKPQKTAPREGTGTIRPLSRGQVQRGFHVGPTGHAVSRLVTDEDQRKLISRAIKSG